MKKLYIIIGLFVLVGAVILWGRKGNEGASSTNPFPTMMKNWEDKTIMEESPEKKFKISVSYPQFKSTSASSLIKTLMDAQVAEFKSGITTNPILPTQMQNIKSELAIENTVVRADDEIISVQLKVMRVYSGMAHPENYNLTFNYDVSGDRELTLANLFIENSEYISKLSEMAKKSLMKKPQIAENPDAKEFIDEGASPKEENFRLFTISSDTLTIVFNPATVAPDYIGTVDVAIAYTDIADILNPQIKLQ